MMHQQPNQMDLFFDGFQTWISDATDVHIICW